MVWNEIQSWNNSVRLSMIVIRLAYRVFHTTYRNFATSTKLTGVVSFHMILVHRFIRKLDVLKLLAVVILNRVLNVAFVRPHSIFILYNAILWNKWNNTVLPPVVFTHFSKLFCSELHWQIIFPLHTFLVHKSVIGFLRLELINNLLLFWPTSKHFGLEVLLSNWLVAKI
jgi:hypothetical protein